MPETMLLEFG